MRNTMDTNFETIGKRMPYTVPTDFFSQNEAALFARTTRRRSLPLICGIAASFALICFVGLWFTSSELTPPLYGYNEQMEDDELASWVEFYEADMFISENFNTSM